MKLSTLSASSLAYLAPLSSTVDCRFRKIESIFFPPTSAEVHTESTATNNDTIIGSLPRNSELSISGVSLLNGTDAQIQVNHANEAFNAEAHRRTLASDVVLNPLSCPVERSRRRLVEKNAQVLQILTAHEVLSVKVKTPLFAGFCGGCGGIRTHDQPIKSRLLYQLSYAPKQIVPLGIEPSIS